MEEKKNVSFQDTKTQSYKPHTNCRVCGSDKMTMYLDLGMMPLPNDLEYVSALAVKKYRMPLQVMLCEECCLSQLSIVVDPKEMFGYYTYRSSINAGYVRHCRRMAIDLKNKYDLNTNSLHIDIAGNDGALLKEFKDEIGLSVLNVDPAHNLCKIAEENGIPSVPHFWSTDLIKTFTGNSDLITATNVFAHVDNVRDFMEACRLSLKPTGVLVLEFPYIVDFIEGYEMDTVYFEHLSYFNIMSLSRLCNLTEMKIISVEKFDIHGGTVRVTITHELSERLIEESVSKFINKEIEGEYCSIEKYLKWAETSEIIMSNFKTNIDKLKAEGHTVYAFAASAKGNTLLNGVGITNKEIELIIDETPEKVKKYSPGTGIMIAPIRYLSEYPPDYLVILSWNFKKEIIEKCKKEGYKGKFIIPVPFFEVL